jgi:c-di-GMP-related signal transduction protein
LPDLLVELNLADAVRSALLNGEGLLGRLLSIVRALEQNRFADVIALLAELPRLSLSQVNQAQIQALGWANELSATAGG